MCFESFRFSKFIETVYLATCPFGTNSELLAWNFRGGMLEINGHIERI